MKFTLQLWKCRRYFSIDIVNIANQRWILRLNKGREMLFMADSESEIMVALEYKVRLSLVVQDRSR